MHSYKVDLQYRKEVPVYILTGTDGTFNQFNTPAQVGAYCQAMSIEPTWSEAAQAAREAANG